MKAIHEKFMRRALVLARKGKGRTSPNPMVGAVIVKGGKVVAEGWHRKCGSDHAEIVALKKAGKSARGATMYVNLEPCYHFGRTPPCVDQLVQCGIKNVYIGMKDPNPRTNGRSIAKLRRNGIQVSTGCLEKESRELNAFFIKYAKTGYPFLAVKCAQSLDGKIATRAGESKWITGIEARQFAKRIRDEYDAIMVGVNTVLADDPGLNGRSKTKKIQKIILDSSLKTPMNARLFRGVSRARCTIAVTKKAAKKRVMDFVKKGVNVIVCPSRNGRIDIQWLLKELARWELTSVLIEGGAQLVGNALKSKMADRVYIYMAPKIFGDEKALGAVTGLRVPKLRQTINVERMTVQKIGRDILITGYV